MTGNLEKKILVIDDDLFLSKLMDHALTDAGYAVITAHEGNAAVKILSKQSVDIIVVDLMMPDMDGLEFLQWLRTEAKLTIPAIVQTGLAKVDTEQKVKAAGATVLIYKPAKIEVLLARIKEIENI